VTTAQAHIPKVLEATPKIPREKYTHIERHIPQSNPHSTKKKTKAGNPALLASLAGISSPNPATLTPRNNEVKRSTQRTQREDENKEEKKKWGGTIWGAKVHMGGAKNRRFKRYSYLGREKKEEKNYKSFFLFNIYIH
jgi:hypothetical protein